MSKARDLYNVSEGSLRATRTEDKRDGDDCWVACAGPGLSYLP